MHVDNRKIVKRINPQLFEQLESLNNKTLSLLIEPSKQGISTVVIAKDEKMVYLHSKYNPIKEAYDFIDKFELNGNVTHAFIVGIGLGYHLEEIVRRNPKIQISIFEPNIEVLYSFLCEKKLNGNVVAVFTHIDQVRMMTGFSKIFSQDTVTVILPVYDRLYQEEIADMKKNLVEYLQSIQGSLMINLGFQRRWSMNSILNYKKILETSNIITEKYIRLFEDKPVILVAAGPSVKEDIECIRQIKNEGTAYIFAVGSGVNVLLHHDIIPHAMFSYDPGVPNYKVFTKIKELQLKNLPLIFGSSIGFEGLEEYPSQLVHMITSADHLSKVLVDIKDTQIIHDSPSVAIMALQVATKLNMSPIILAGQNLGFLNNVMYAEGGELARGSNELSEQEQQNLMVTKDVTGEEIYTNRTYMDMKKSLELIIRANSQATIFNTTKKGAQIDGVPFINLEEVQAQYLTKQQIVKENWVIDTPEYSNGVKNYELLLGEYRTIIKYLMQAIAVANRIKKNTDAKIYSQINELFFEFVKPFSKVMASTSYDAIIRPTVTVQHEKFGQTYKRVEIEKNVRKKSELFLEIYVPFLHVLSSIIPDLNYVVEYARGKLKETEQIKN